MARKYDVVATIGKYEKDGQTKYINHNELIPNFMQIGLQRLSRRIN